MFTHHTTGYSLILLVYMDDIVFTSSPHAPFASLLLALQCEFAIKDLGSFHYFLGVEVQHSSDGLILHHAKFSLDILDRAKMKDVKVVSTP